MKPTHKRVLDALHNGFDIKKAAYSRKWNISRPKLSEPIQSSSPPFEYVKYLGEDVLFTIQETTFREMQEIGLIQYDSHTRQWVPK